jgi:hypothetical protein
MVRVAVSEASMVNVMVLDGPVQWYPVAPPVAAAASVELGVSVVNTLVAVVVGATKVVDGMLEAMLVASVVLAVVGVYAATMEEEVERVRVVVTNVVASVELGS